MSKSRRAMPVTAAIVAVSRVTAFLRPTLVSVLITFRVRSLGWGWC